MNTDISPSQEPRGFRRIPGVIDSAFALLDLVAELQPARLVDLSAASAMPHPTVHRLLQQLIHVGAVRRDGSRYSLGASLLSLGAAVTPSARMRIAARRPMAELATFTGASVSLSASLGGSPVYLDTFDACARVRFIPRIGAAVPAETAQGRAHVTRSTAMATAVIDAGQVAVDHSCVAVGISMGSSVIGVVSTMIAEPKPSARMFAGTRRAAEIITKAINGTPFRDDQ